MTDDNTSPRPDPELRFLSNLQDHLRSLGPQTRERCLFMFRDAVRDMRRLDEEQVERVLGYLLDRAAPEADRSREEQARRKAAQAEGTPTPPAAGEPPDEPRGALDLGSPEPGSVAQPDAATATPES